VYARLQTGTDPATWYFDAASYDAVAVALAAPGAPLTVEVIAPLKGQLVLNPRAAGSVALTLPVMPVGYNPSGLTLPGSTLLYVPSATGPTHQAPGYVLAGGQDLAALEQEIVTAMTAGTTLTLTLDVALPGKGVLTLSGGTLAFAVICPPAPVTGP
jgi:hypothetical protein